jgi:Mg/Co/Ni transporter MgtE
MGVEYLTLPASTSVADAVAAVAAATTIQPEALANIYTPDEHGRLAGVAAVVTLLQTTPTTPLHAAAQPNPVRVHPHADLIEVTTLMADHNLLTLPVIDENQQIIGLITIDDVLEATIPHNWRHREHTPGG